MQPGKEHNILFPCLQHPGPAGPSAFSGQGTITSCKCGHSPTAIEVSMALSTAPSFSNTTSPSTRRCQHGGVPVAITKRCFKERTLSCWPTFIMQTRLLERACRTSTLAVAHLLCMSASSIEDLQLSSFMAPRMELLNCSGVLKSTHGWNRQYTMMTVLVLICCCWVLRKPFLAR